MGLNANALITLKNLKVYLAIDRDDYNPLLEKLINAVSQDLQNRLHRDLIYTSYSSIKLNGNGQSNLYLPAWPVWSISALTEGDEARTEDTDYFTYGTERQKGYLMKTTAGETEETDAVWEKGNKNITISYIAGYWIGEDPDVGTETEMPDDIQMAVSAQVSIFRRRFGAEDFDISAQSFPDGSITKVTSELHPLYKEIIERYRRPVI